MAMHFVIEDADEFLTPRQGIAEHALKVRNEANPFFIVTDTFGLTTDELRALRTAIDERLAYAPS